MTEGSMDLSPGSDNSQPGNTSPAPAPTQSAPIQTQHEERNFKQSDVNEIVKRAKYDAVENYRKLQSEQPSYVQQKYADSGTNQPQHTQPTNTFNENDYRRIASEEAQRLRDQWMQEATNKAESENAQRIVQNFHNKISPGREKYEDFDKVIGDPRQYAKFPHVVQLLANYVDNSEDIIYELAKNKGKMANLEMMAREYPDEAISEAQKLSQSLKDNATAGKYRTPNEPLNQMRPSNTGTDSGVLSVKDLRRKYKV